MQYGPMAAGPDTVQREANLLVTVIDVSDAFSQSLQLENPAHQVGVIAEMFKTRKLLTGYLAVNCIAMSGQRDHLS